MYAIIEDSGSQIKVSTGDTIRVDLRDADDGSMISFDRVLAIGDPDGGKTRIGTPYLAGAKVEAEVIGEVQGDKVITGKYRRRKGYRLKKGHRQDYLQVKIGAISG